MIRLLLSILAFIPAILLTIPVIVLIVPVGLFISLFTIVRMLLQPRDVPGNRIIHYEPGIGWKPAAGLDTVYADRIGDRCSIVTDEQGWPGKYSLADSDIVVFGDSFAYGYGSPFHRAYFSLVNRYKVKPVAAPGYNMVQGLLLMRRYASQLRGKTVFWFVCMENDLAENLKPYNPKFYTMPFMRKNGKNGEWEIITGHLSQKAWPGGDGSIGNKELFANICSDSPYSKRAFSGVRYLLQQAKELCDSVHARLVVFTIPDKDQLTEHGIKRLNRFVNGSFTFDPEYPDKQFANMCEEMNIRLISGYKHLTMQDYKERDGHWNDRGNRKVANIIQDHLT